MTECVETCPYCGAENVYENISPVINRYKAVCKECGREIFLCDECLHADDNKKRICDWYEDKNGCSCCFRGKCNVI